jgi:hypothetical protein
MIRKFMKDGVLYLTDGEITLPAIAGAQVDWDNYAAGAGSSREGAGGSAGGPTNIIGQYIVGPDGSYYVVGFEQTPQGQKSLVLLDPNNPRGQAIPFPGAGTYYTADHRAFTVDAGGRVVGNVRNVPQGEWENYLTTGSGVGSYSPTVVGARAPDPASAAQILLDYYDRQVQAGQIPVDRALREFEANLNRAQVINADIRERQIAEAQRAVRLAEEAGSRARTVAQDILPRSIPNASQVTLPLLGTLPINQVNLDTFFGQGLPALSDLPVINLMPGEPYPGPLSLPAPQPPQLPDLDTYIADIVGGFPGFVV